MVGKEKDSIPLNNIHTKEDKKKREEKKKRRRRIRTKSLF